MKKIIILPIILAISLTSCFAREMVIVDPIVSFQEQGVKTILLAGFNIPSTVKVSSKFKDRLESDIYKEFEKFNAIKIIKLDEKESLSLTYKKEDLNLLAQKYKSDLVIIGDLKSYNESKFIDQASQSFSNDPNSISNNNDLRSFNRFQLSVTGNISLIKPDGKILWTQRIEELESTQFEGSKMTNTLPLDQNELAIYVNTRNQIADGISAKIVKNLLPYYYYK